jgi:hypothetical protein
MEAVPDLMSPTPKSDVLQGLPASPGVDPEAKDSLICFAKLSGSSKDSATVDPNGEVKGHSILEGE